MDAATVIDDYALKRSLLSDNLTAKYTCPNKSCREQLTSAEDESGQPEHCPSCQSVFRLSRTALDIQKQKDVFQKQQKRASEIKKQFEDDQRRATELAHKKVRDEAEQNNNFRERAERLREQKERRAAVKEFQHQQ